MGQQVFTVIEAHFASLCFLPTSHLIPSALSLSPSTPLLTSPPSPFFFLSPFPFQSFHNPRLPSQQESTTAMFSVPEDHVHRHTVVEEVGEPEHQIVVQDVPPLVDSAFVATRQHVGPTVARQHRKHTRRQLVADVIDAVVA